MTITLSLTTQDVRNIAGLIDIALVQRLEQAQRDAQAREAAPQS